MKHFVVALALLLALPAYAEDAPTDELHALYEKGDYTGARALLVQMYETAAKPELLFALGQVEFKLGHYQAAITDYEKFIAAAPDEKQAALAYQALGAARFKLAHPTVVPPPPVLHYPPRQWTRWDSGFVVASGTIALAGGGVYLYSHHLAVDPRGTLADFDDRAARARKLRWTAIGLGAAGLVLAAVTVVRWRLRPDGGVVVTAQLSPGGLIVSGLW